jgi:hypothetical protein
VKGSYLRPIAARWEVGAALLLFALAGPAMATGTIKGTVTAAAKGTLTGALVYATSDKFIVVHDMVSDSDGTYSLDVDPGTYTVAIVADNQDVDPVKNVVVADGKTITQDFKLADRKPFPIVKSPNPIPLDQDIDSAAFMDVQDINLNMGQNEAVGPGDQWGMQGGPKAVSGRFRLKYSTQAIHVAADLTFKTPKVNTFITTDPTNLWNGNGLEFDVQNDPYTSDRTDKDANHDWQLVVGLGDATEWYLHGSVNAKPGLPVSAGVLRKDKTTKDGELVRVDIPWSILLQGDATGKPIAAPADNALGAFDIALDASDPTADRSTAVRLWQLSWSGFPNGHWNASSLVAVQYVTQAPASPPKP